MFGSNSKNNLKVPKTPNSNSQFPATNSSDMMAKSSSHESIGDAAPRRQSSVSSPASPSSSVSVNVPLFPPADKTNDKIKEMYSSLGRSITIKGYSQDRYFTFDSMNLDSAILRAIYEKCNWEYPSPIQSIGIKPVIDGLNLVCQAQTGTGKTGTYTIAILQKINPEIKSCQAMILTPTRELTRQVYDEAIKLASFTNITIGGHIGGYNRADARGVDYLHNVRCEDMDGINVYNSAPYREQVVIGTPGRIERLCSSKKLDMNELNLVVIDEADKMFSQGFLDTTIKIFASFEKGKVQTALYSATIDAQVRNMCAQFMGNNCVHIRVPQERVATNNQTHYMANVEDENGKLEMLKTIFKKTMTGQVFIFCNRIHKIDAIEREICDMGIVVSSIHSQKEQDERNLIVEDFRANRIKVLITTDVLARGFDTVAELVINYDVPTEAENYIHRAGRVGRFGTQGSVINLILNSDKQLFSNIVSKYSINFLRMNQFLSK